MHAHTLRLIAPAIAAVLLCLPCFAAAGAGNDPARRAAVDSAGAEAATLLEKGDATGAYELYMRLWREAPDDEAVILGLARAAAGAKRFNQAVIAYETLLEKYPREAGLYGELAHVYMMLGDRESAERSVAVTRSPDGGAPEESSRALDVLESRYSLLQIHGRVRAGLMYDSNANMGPDSEDLRLGDWRVNVPDAGRKDSFGAYLGADLDLGRRFFRDSPWWLVGDVKGFWRGYGNSSLHDRLHSRESQWGRGGVGARHVGAKTLVDLRFKAEIFDYEFLQHVAALGPELTFLYAPTPSVQLITSAGWDSR
ncbi:MAG: tetratricopeptide repeat protein, partial [Desulfovibrio sp.]|nr:tetratricopeptide repeat protein [Desulfovibrio sp.]